MGRQISLEQKKEVVELIMGQKEYTLFKINHQLFCKNYPSCPHKYCGCEDFIASCPYNQILIEKKYRDLRKFFSN